MSDSFSGTTRRGHSVTITVPGYSTMKVDGIVKVTVVNSFSGTRVHTMHASSVEAFIAKTLA